MPGLREVAREHARKRRRLGQVAAGEAASLWSRLDRSRVVDSWTTSVARLLVVVTGAQLAVAAKADGYLQDVVDAQGIRARAQGKTDPHALAGVASDGRDLADLLFQPALVTLTALQDGRDPALALAGGAAGLDMIVRTQVADAGRVADQVATVARPQLTGYVRMLSLPACSRCIVLAGRRYDWNTGFSRHPSCDCVHVPAAEDSADDARTEPRAAFDSLTAEQQDKAFTKAGAEAIRLGADIGQTVNARSGMYVAGDKTLTRTAASGRGRSGIRLMPEQILLDAGGDRDEAIRLLRRFGYLT